jgi:Domain of unknown function (DUF4405)
MKTTLKSWATPLVISAFIISGVTGVLLFFHKESGLVKPVHEWLSWALVGGAVLHTAANWKPFRNWFTKRSALAIISVGAIVTAASVTVPGDSRHGNPMMKISHNLSASSLETLAPVANLTPEEAVAKLEKGGLKISDDSNSIKQIAADNGRKDEMVLAALFE